MLTPEGGIKAGSFDTEVSQITCQFIGANVALGKPVYSYYKPTTFGANRGLVTDGDWNEGNDPAKVFKGNDATVDKHTWVAIDLGTQHVITHVMLKSDTSVTY